MASVFEATKFSAVSTTIKPGRVAATFTWFTPFVGGVLSARLLMAKWFPDLFQAIPWGYPTWSNADSLSEIDVASAVTTPSFLQA